jgi:hypothetical protein
MAPGDGKLLKLTASAKLPGEESCWVAARVMARKHGDGPDIQAHTNPVYVLRDGAPVLVRPARESVIRQWEEQLAWYKGAGMVFRDPANQQEFFGRADRTSAELRRPLK